MNPGSGSTPEVHAPNVDRPRDAGQGTAAAMFALCIAGICAFLNLYATQPLLPLLEQVFAVSKADAAWTVSAPTIAMALCSPFVGALADRIGRRRLIISSLFALSVPTLLAATSRTMAQLVAWRFVQGLIVPGVYAVSIAYVGEAWAAGGVGRAMSALITGNVIGGFSGRFIGGLTAEWAGWRAAFVVLALITAAGAIASARWLPREAKRARAPAHPLRALRDLARQLDGPLAATFAVGFNVLFTQVATFTYITFYLAAPPFQLGVGQLSTLFVVYLVGAIITPFAGRWIDRAGSRAMLVAALVVAIAGLLLTLAPPLWAVILGLALQCTAVFVSQSASTSFLHRAARAEARSTASGVYVSCYYVGGSAGGVLPALAWHLGGWPGCVALVVAVQLATIALAWRYWRVPDAVPSPFDRLRANGGN